MSQRQRTKQSGIGHGVAAHSSHGWLCHPSLSRGQQISEFIRLNPSALHTFTAADGTATYQVPIQTGSAGLLTLQIHLGPLFPERPPVCQLTTQAQGLRLQHRYLDAGGYLSQHPKLQQAQWSPHTSFAMLVQQLAREIVQQPPQLVGGQAPAFSSPAQGSAAPPPMQFGGPAPPSAQYGYYPHPSPPSQPPQPSPHSHFDVSASNGQLAAPVAQHANPFMRAGPSALPPQQPSPQPQLSNGGPPLPPVRPSSEVHMDARNGSSGVVRSRPPDVPQSFPHLDGLSIQSLEDVLAGGDDAVRDMAAELEPVKQLEKFQRECAQKVGAKARENLAAKSNLEALTQQLAAETARLKESQRLHAALQQRQHASQSHFTLSSLLPQLDVAIAQAEEESEQSKERFESLNPKQAAANGAACEEQAVLELYIKQRMLVHERSAKKERLTEIYGRH
jgi:hypothetical protein